MIINKIKAAFLYGRGMKKFLLNNFNGAIVVFEKIIKINPDDKKNGYVRYFLGRSYYYAGDKQKAKNEMALAFDILSKMILIEKNGTAIDYFEVLSKEYMELLLSINEKEELKKVKSDSKKVEIASHMLTKPDIENYKKRWNYRFFMWIKRLRGE